MSGIPPNPDPSLPPSPAILVDHNAVRMGNAGDVAMLQVLVRRILHRWPHARVTVLTYAPDIAAAMLPGVQCLQRAGQREWIDGAYSLTSPIPLLPRALNHRQRWLQCRLHQRFPGLALWRFRRRNWPPHSSGAAVRRYLQTIADADAVIVAGGGTFNDQWVGPARDQLHLLRTAHRLRCATAMVGQGIGPIHSREMKALLHQASGIIDFLGVREERMAPGLLLAAGFPPDRFAVTGDDAIEPAYQARPSALGADLGINLRLAQYSGVSAHVIDAIKPVLHDAADRRHAQFRPIPISFNEGEADNHAIAALAGQRLAVPLPAREHGPAAVIREAGGCRIAVVGSYHAGVFALAQGVPVIALAASAYYDNKLRGLQQQFGDGCIVLDAPAPDLPAQLACAIDDLWARADNLRPGLLDAALRQIQAGHAFYDRLFDRLQRRPFKTPATPPDARSTSPSPERASIRKTA